MGTLAEEIAELRAAVEAQTTVVDSAVTLINGFSARLQAAIEAATAAGATAEQLAELQSLQDSVVAETTKLGEAVAANTPTA